MRKKRRANTLWLCIGLLALVISGCMGGFSPVVRPSEETVRLNVVVNEEAQGLLSSVYQSAVAQTGTITATSTRGASVTKTGVALNGDRSNVSFKLPEGVWDVAFAASSNQYGVLYTGVAEGISVVAGQVETHTVELGLATGDVEFSVNLAGFERGYQSPMLTLLSPYDSIPNRTMPITIVSGDMGTVVFSSVPVGPWRAAVSADTPGQGTLEIMSASAVQPLGAGSVSVDVAVPLYSEYGILDLTIRNWGNYPPRRPVSVTAEQRANNRVRIEWEVPDDQVEGVTMRYAVYRKLAPAEEGNYATELIEDGISGLFHSDEDDAAPHHITFGSRHGLTYAYWVQAYYVSGSHSFASRLSEPATVTLTMMDGEIPDVDPEPDPQPIDPGDDTDVVDGLHVSVDTQEALDDAVANVEVGKITFTDDIGTGVELITITRPLTIDFGEFTFDGDVEITAAVNGDVTFRGNAEEPDFDVTGTLTDNSSGGTTTNYARWEGASPSIIITGSGVFIEGAVGNKIRVTETADGIQITIGDGATVANLTILAGASGVEIINEGVITAYTNGADDTEYSGNEPGSDASTAVSVSSEAEFVAALGNEAVTRIIFRDDINLTANRTVGYDQIVDLNGNTLNMYTEASEYSKLTIPTDKTLTIETSGGTALITQSEFDGDGTLILKDSVWMATSKIRVSDVHVSHEKQLKQALSSESAPGTIFLLNDIVSFSSADFPEEVKGVTLDLGGFSWDVTCHNTEKRITVEDATIENGTLKVWASGSTVGTVRIVGVEDVTFEDLTLGGGVANPAITSIAEGAELTFEGTSTVAVGATFIYEAANSMISGGGTHLNRNVITEMSNAGWKNASNAATITFELSKNLLASESIEIETHFLQGFAWASGDQSAHIGATRGLTATHDGQKKVTLTGAEVAAGTEIAVAVYPDALASAATGGYIRIFVAGETYARQQPLDGAPLVPLTPTATLAEGTDVGTTKLESVTDAMEYRVEQSDGTQKVDWTDTGGTSVDNISVDATDVIKVRVKATLEQPASEIQELTVTEDDIKPAE